jgi:hypothetical protein
MKLGTHMTDGERRKPIDNEVCRTKVKVTLSIHMFATRLSWFFLLFIWFQLFSSDKKIRKVAGHCQNRSKRGHFESGCRWFQLFFIDFHLFYFIVRIIPDRTGDLLKEVQFIWNVLWQDRVRGPFKLRWLLNRGNHMGRSDFIFFLMNIDV